jgi:hypothetical protein
MRMQAELVALGLCSSCTSTISLQKVSITTDGASTHASCELQSSQVCTAGWLYIGLGGIWSHQSVLRQLCPSDREGLVLLWSCVLCVYMSVKQSSSRDPTGQPLKQVPTCCARTASHHQA